MDVTIDTDPQTGETIIIGMNRRERELLAEDAGLPVLLHTAMEAIVALRSGQRPAGTSTEAGNWVEMIHRTSQLIRILEGALDGEIRAHAAVKGSYGQLAKALGVPRSTAQTQRDALLAKAPSQWEPQLPPLRSTEEYDGSHITACTDPNELHAIYEQAVADSQDPSLWRNARRLAELDAATAAEALKSLGAA